jgi:hypothetical protein
MKTGRKRKDWVNTMTGKPVVGLARRPSDKRWRIIETGYTFTEPDEFLAIAKFERLTAKSLPITIGDTKTTFTYNAIELEDFLRHLSEKNDAPFWNRVTQELTTRPKYAAERTGIEKLAYINDLKPPEPSAKLAKLKEIWNAQKSPAHGTILSRQPASPPSPKSPLPCALAIRTTSTGGAWRENSNSTFSAASRPY